ncbi:hypothetical protein [Roseimaritima ulvae]|uniref:hypothetical protein n=1 Tax=Roseimaritima ulvae TaxID=980254 RepID=UPI001EE4AA4E|nr:hypothetical protein [Roseimaritima ulvae]
MQERCLVSIGERLTVFRRHLTRIDRSENLGPFFSGLNVLGDIEAQIFKIDVAFLRRRIVTLITILLKQSAMLGRHLGSRFRMDRMPVCEADAQAHCGERDLCGAVRSASFITRVHSGFVS